MFAKDSSCARIFHALYAHRRASQNLLARELKLSRPTLAQGLRTLEEEGLITRNGTYPSSGGRPATAWELRADARFAVGVELTARQAHLVAMDLYGTVLARHVEDLGFAQTPTYYTHVAQLIAGMVDGLSDSARQLLGATIAIQGIVDERNQVSFGGLLANDEVNASVEDFSRRLPYPLRLVHDAEAAAYAELWRHRSLPSFAYLSLNDHLGSAVVVAGELLHGGALGAGVAEHMVLHANGVPCYCGGRGCAETTLGALALERATGLSVEAFFARLRQKDSRCAAAWDAYLTDLALLAHNVRMVVCSDIVVGGRLSPYLSETDLRVLRTRATAHGALARTGFRLVRGQFGDKAAVMGAGLLQVDAFLQQL